MSFFRLLFLHKQKTINKKKNREENFRKKNELASLDLQYIDLILVNQPHPKQIKSNKNSSTMQQEAQIPEVMAESEKIDNEVIIKYINSLEDIKNVNRLSYKNTSAIQENTAAIEELNYNLEQTGKDIKQLKYSLDEVLIYQRQENGNLKREIEGWEQAAVDYFRLLERAINCEADRNQSFLQKILDEFANITVVRGLERVIPRENQHLNEKLHEAVEIEESYEISPGNIIKCKYWGYRVGSHVIEKAKVVIASSPKTK
jgi:molecular chaperone GrpE (heat shock protein)